jgi:hypothetical protein
MHLILTEPPSPGLVGTRLAGLITAVKGSTSNALDGPSALVV